MSWVFGTVVAVAFSAVLAVAPAGAQPATGPADAPPPAPAPAHVPPAIALDPSLTKPLPGDTAETLAARDKLAKLDEAYQVANQLYDQARADAEQAATEVVQARAAATQATVDARRAHATFALMITAEYEGANDAGFAGGLLVARGPGEIIDQLEMRRVLADRTAGILDAAQRTQAAAAAARQRLEQAVTAARLAEARSQHQLVAASHAVKAAQDTVTQLHAADLEAAIEASADSLGAAATAIEGQAITSKAATVREFAIATGPAQVISIGTRALLEQAAGVRKLPKHLPEHPPAGSPTYEPTTGAPVDEQAVMGPPPDLGSTVPYTGATGAGPVLALTDFDGTVSTDGWPNSGVGRKVRGTAPFLKPDGRTVHPVLPPYRNGYQPLRAEVAVDAALSKLGSQYVWDAAGPATFDCSGLTLWAWGHAGVSLEHYTGDQVHQGERVEANELLPGDLLLFGTQLHHVGMYLGAGYMIDAPSTGDYVKVQPVSDDADFTVAVRP